MLKHTLFRLAPFCCVLLLMFSLPAYAQVSTGEAESTSEPDFTGVAVDMVNEVIFPQAFRLSLYLAVESDQVESAALTIRPDGQEAISISISPEDITEADERYTEVIALWNFPSDSPPRLFSDIDVNWTATTTDGNVSTARGTFLFTDQRAEWVSFEDPADQISLVVASSGSPPSRLRRDLQPAYDLLVLNTSAAPRFSFMLYEENVVPGCQQNEDGDSVAVGPLSGVSITCSPRTAAAIYQTAGLTPVQRQISGVNSAIITLLDAMLPDFFAAFWDGRDVPAWFRSGLVQFYLPVLRSSDYQLSPMLASVRSGRDLSLADLSSLPQAADEADRWRAQSFSLVLYMADQFGVAGLNQLARSVATAPDFASAYQTTTGRSLNSLIEGWRIWLFTDDAVAAYGYTPYQPATATPTSSPTATATITPSPTVTPTVTPTATVTGVLTFTPPPTSIPTRTPTARPPTSTPRPAGSLDTPTPVPAGPAFALPTDPTRVGLLALAGLALLVILLGLIRLRR